MGTPLAVGEKERAVMHSTSSSLGLMKLTILVTALGAASHQFMKPRQLLTATLSRIVAALWPVNLTSST